MWQELHKTEGGMSSSPPDRDRGQAYGLQSLTRAREQSAFLKRDSPRKERRAREEDSRATVGVAEAVLGGFALSLFRLL